MATRRAPASIAAYIAAQPPQVRPVLRKIRATVARAAPRATETISYRIPTFVLHGALVHFAAFTAHIGFYPPVTGDARLKKAVARYAGPKGNLRLPLDEPIPYALIARIVRLRVRQNEARQRERAARRTRQ